MSTPRSVTVRVPGSTSNLGSGFDTLGLALRIYNRVTVTVGGVARTRLTSPLDAGARAGATAMVREAAAAFFRAAGRRREAFEIHVAGDVPLARGLGSSTTVQLGCVAALNALAGAPLSRHQVFELVAGLEGHPDNAAPATYGGFTVAGLIAGGARVQRFAVPRAARFVTLIPDYEVRTSEARRLLPGSYPVADVAHALSRAALVTAAFARGDLAGLRDCFDDRVHQPYRQTLIPALGPVIEAGVRAGAVGGWLSGSGSTIICLATGGTEAVAGAMTRAE
ncbi:MAG: homoserine kinase, partial [Verrucomicrobiota bacterium]